MQTAFKNTLRFGFSLIMVPVILWASWGEGKGEAFTTPAASPTVYLPLVTVPPIGTPFGAFLDGAAADGGLSKMVAANASWVHLPFPWSAVEPQVGQRNWAAVSQIEKILITSANQHVNVILYLQDTPKWALKPGFICGAVAPDKLPDLSRFLTDLVQRYSAPLFNVKTYELWSEAEVFGGLGCWGDPSDTAYYGGGYYAQMLKSAYPVIKTANPLAQVIFAGLLIGCNPNICGDAPSHFLDGALVNGAGNFFDGISFHAYDAYSNQLGQYSNGEWASAWNTTGPVFLAKAAYLRQRLAQYHLSGKFLINTELALICGYSGLEAPCVTDVHAASESIYLVQGFAAGIADGLRANIWYSVAGWRGSALLDSSLKPTPAYTAFTNAGVRIGAGTFSRKITEYTGLHGYEFTNAGKKVWVVWSVTSTGNPHPITLSSAPAAVYTMYGVPQPASTSLAVGLEPLYVEFGP